MPICSRKSGRHAWNFSSRRTQLSQSPFQAVPPSIRRPRTTAFENPHPQFFLVGERPAQFIHFIPQLKTGLLCLPARSLNRPESNRVRSGVCCERRQNQCRDRLFLFSWLLAALCERLLKSAYQGIDRPQISQRLFLDLAIAFNQIGIGVIAAARFSLVFDDDLSPRIIRHSGRLLEIS